MALKDCLADTAVMVTSQPPYWNEPFVRPQPNVIVSRMWRPEFKMRPRWLRPSPMSSANPRPKIVPPVDPNLEQRKSLEQLIGVFFEPSFVRQSLCTLGNTFGIAKLRQAFLEPDSEPQSQPLHVRLQRLPSLIDRTTQREILKYIKSGGNWLIRLRSPVTKISTYLEIVR